jgi:hypothetical protein
VPLTIKSSFVESIVNVSAVYVCNFIQFAPALFAALIVFTAVSILPL